MSIAGGTAGADNSLSHTYILAYLGILSAILVNLKRQLKLASPARKFTIRQIENKFFSNKSGACHHIFKVKNYTLIYSFYADQVLNSAEKQIFSLNRYSLLEYILKISANGGPV